MVVLSGAGMSAESGLKTFRDSGGLWEGHRIEQVATPEAWRRDPQLVLEFYNERRKDLLAAMPNEGHRALVALEQDFEVTVVTQNVDDLHERAGSRNVIHLHGELRKARSTCDPRLVYEIAGCQLNLGEHCERGSQLRPHIVWFGEMVPELERGAEAVSIADYVIVVGTSMSVYPAAGLILAAPKHAKKFLVDPKRPQFDAIQGIDFLEEKASTGVPKVVQRIISLG